MSVAASDTPSVSHAIHLDRTQRLKDARTEASKEIEEYKHSKDREFSDFESSVCLLLTTHVRLLTLEVQYAGSTQNAQSAVDKDAEAKLQIITGAYTTYKDEVVEKLLNRVVLVEPELHRNLKLADRA